LDKKVIFIALLIGVIQLICGIYISLFSGFGKSPYFNSIYIPLYVLYFSFYLIGFEYVRTFLLNITSYKHKLRGILFVSLVLSILSISFNKITFLSSPLSLSSFLGVEYLPSFSQNLLSSYLNIMGGPLASIAYRWVLYAFEWLSPILPDMPWLLESVVGSLMPVVGIFLLTNTLERHKLVRLGVMKRNEAKVKSDLKKELKGVVPIFVLVILMWGSVGLLGFKPTVIASGSMRPALEVGDVAITVPIKTEDLKTGDIIRYFRSDESILIIHRVVSIDNQGGNTLIVTKGDANNARDLPFTASSTEIYRTVIIIPKIGWVSLALRNISSDTSIATLLTPFNALCLISVTLILVIASYFIYYNNPHVRLRRRLGR
jgi:signal peptidase